MKINPVSKRILVLSVLLALLNSLIVSQSRGILESGGVLSQEQASYDVKHYALNLDVDPTQKSIAGTVTITSLVVQPMYFLVLDLDTLLVVDNIVEENTTVQKVQSLDFTRRDGQIWIALGHTRQPGEMLRVKVGYHGNPRVAKRPPWDGAFTWAKTKSGAHWIATTCQGEGADLWWPCKDHVSDEPDSMDLHITVPEDLVVASNGRLIETSAVENQRRAYKWHISQPINIYNVALNIAPYELIETEYQCITGETFPFQFYVLPEDLKKGEKIFPEFQDHMKFYEALLGPYPFRADKYGVAQTPHLGMEHQSIIAYGANFNNGSMTGGKDWGFDALHHHELAHEWWGNLVTNASWEDMWIHEGFGTYMQALYCEQLDGEAQYDKFMQNIRGFQNLLAVAPRATLTSNEIYKAPIYPKGAWVLHTLRNYIGDEAFFEALKLMVYPTATDASRTDGRQCRFVTTDDFMLIAESRSGMDLEWFFDLYLRQPALPVLHIREVLDVRVGRDPPVHVQLSWSTPTGTGFPIPVEIQVGNRLRKMVVPEVGLTIKLKKGEKLSVDPRRKILCDIVRD